MEFLKNIFARVWALWGLVWFIITFILVLPPTFVVTRFAYPKSQDYMIGIARVWMRIWLFLVGCRVTITGLSNFKKKEKYIVVFNHRSFLDVTISCPNVPGGNKTIAKKEFTAIPIFAWYYKKGGVIVDRKNEQSRKKSFDLMRQVLAEGMHMCLYPEGTRNKTTEPLKPFYDGAFKLAIETGNKIIPAIIVNTEKAMPIDKPFYLLPTHLYLNFLPPASTENTDAETLKSTVFEIMKTNYLRMKSTIV